MQNTAAMSDIEEEQFAEIDDELLISIVQANPCLYAKNDQNFKNNKLKDMKWEVIANTLNCTTSEAKKRWDTLRNQFCKKRRQQKNQPSGSGTLAEWPLMSCMSFLTPHIRNRKTRSSLLLKSISTCNETSSSTSSPVLSPTAAYALQSQNIMSCTDSDTSIWNDDFCESLNIENTENIENIPANHKLCEVPKETGNIVSIPKIPKTQKAKVGATP